MTKNQQGASLSQSRNDKTPTSARSIHENDASKQRSVRLPLPEAPSGRTDMGSRNQCILSDGGLKNVLINQFIF